MWAVPNSIRPLHRTFVAGVCVWLPVSPRSFHRNRNVWLLFALGPIVYCLVHLHRYLLVLRRSLALVLVPLRQSVHLQIAPLRLRSQRRPHHRLRRPLPARTHLKLAVFVSCHVFGYRLNLQVTKKCNENNYKLNCAPFSQ